MNENKLNDAQLDAVSGGSWKITEAEAAMAGLTLRNEDGTAGEFGYLWNSGDYYWNGQKVDPNQAEAIVVFVKKNGYRPKTVEEAVNAHRKNYTPSF